MDITIDVNALCGKNKVSRDDGRVLYNKINDELMQHAKVTVDLGNILVASVSFLDEAFGTLAKDKSRSEIVKRINLINIQEFDRALLNDILRSRYRQSQLA